MRGSSVKRPKKGEPHLPLLTAWIEEARGKGTLTARVSWEEAGKYFEGRGLVPVVSKLTGSINLAKSTGFLSKKATWEEYSHYCENYEMTPVRTSIGIELRSPDDAGPSGGGDALTRLRKIPRRHLFLFLASVWSAELRAGKFTRSRGAAILGVSSKDVYFLTRHRLQLYKMVAPVRRCSGLPARGRFKDRKSSDHRLDADVSAALLPLTTPTGVLSLIARVLHRDGERTAYRVLRYLDRAMAGPEGKEAGLASLLARYGMTASVPKSLRSRVRATPPPVARKKPAEVELHAVPAATPQPVPAAPVPPPSGPPPAAPARVAAGPVPSETPTPTPGAAPAAPPEGKICPRCGALVRIPGGGAPKFCSSCTAPLS